MRKIPMRRCIVSQQQYPKQELTRIVLTPENNVEIDLSGRQNGRGAYIYLTKENIALAKTNRALDRALRTKIPAEIYEMLDSYAK